MKRILILLDYDLTLTEELQQVSLFEEHFEAIKKQYQTYKTLIGLQEGQPVWSEEQPVAHPLDYFRINDYHYYTVQHGLRWLQQLYHDSHTIFKGLTKNTFEEIGKNKQKLSPNVIEGLWHLKNIWKERGITITYAIVSIGLKEILQASPINDVQTGEHLISNIFAGEYIYDKQENIIGIKNAPSAFDKTRAIIELVKGGPHLLDTFMAHSDYQYDYRNIIVIGDGFSDISYFSYVREKGGKAIAVYKAGDTNAFKKAFTTIGDRADWLLPRDYNPNGRTITELNNIIREIVERTCNFDPTLLHQYRRGRINHPDVNEVIQKHLNTCKECNGHHTLRWVPPA